MPPNGVGQGQGQVEDVDPAPATVSETESKRERGREDSIGTSDILHHRRRLVYMPPYARVGARRK